jgi:hemerythrin
MSLIIWKQEFSVGDVEIDLEHQALIENINALHRSTREGVTRGQVIDSLNEIYQQIAAHFAHEETLMRDAHYRQFAEHKADHEILLDDLRDIMEEVDEDGEYEERQLSIDLDRWFSDHFHTHDARLHSHTGQH